MAPRDHCQDGPSPDVVVTDFDPSARRMAELLDWSEEIAGRGSWEYQGGELHCSRNLTTVLRRPIATLEDLHASIHPDDRERMIETVREGRDSTVRLRLATGNDERVIIE